MMHHISLKLSNGNQPSGNPHGYWGCSELPTVIGFAGHEGWRAKPGAASGMTPKEETQEFESSINAAFRVLPTAYRHTHHVTGWLKVFGQPRF